jgi:dolichyl-phosphate-mannose-protein mannosyltransferase
VNNAPVIAGQVAQPRDRSQERSWAGLTAIVLGAAVINGLLAIPIRRPRVFGDELIYWQLSRGLAWTGHFTARGVAAPRYGVVYPALLAVAQRLGSDQVSAYAIAQGLNAVMFSLTAVPVYLIASRVVRERYALVAALLSVVLPSSIYTSNIFTENAFYPLFMTTVLLMLRALDRPSAARQLLVAAAVGVTFLVRAQAVVLLPSYLVAAVLSAVVTSRVGWRSAIRQQAPTVAVLALAAVAAAAIPGRSTLGPYHVLVTSPDLRSLAHWAVANVADLELYVGVVPMAAFGVLLVGAFASSRASPELRRLVILTACVGAGLLATVAVLSASPYGLGRIHDRNLFYLVPLVLIAFLAWLEAEMPRPRLTTAVIAVVVVLLPVTIPRPAVDVSGEDGVALIPWVDMKIRPSFAIAAMVAAAAVAAVVFLRSRRPAILIGICVAALAAATAAAEVHAVDALAFRAPWRDFGWIDRAVGPDARVVALWAAPSQNEYWRIEGLWSDEFYNRSVRGVASADGPLPDGLPVEELTIRPDGCLEGALRSRPEYAVVATARRLTAPVVRVSPSRRAILYRLGSDGRCLARLQPR